MLAGPEPEPVAVELVEGREEREAEPRPVKGVINRDER